jgi:glycosyltransferase involved in cell wall biosynthesis
MKTAVLIMSCDKYQDLWQPFFTLYNKYWKHDYKTYIGTETKECKYATTIKTQGVWSKRVREALEQIDSEYIIFLLDDFFFHREVDQTRIEYVLSQFDKETASVNLEQAYDEQDIESTLKGFKLRQNKRPYLNSCQPTIWNRKKLIERLQKDQTPHEWELSTVDSPYKHYINAEELVFDIGYYKERKPWCVVQGKWAVECRDLFKRENIDVDFNQRGFFDMKLSIIIPYYKTKEATEKLLDKLCPQLTKEVEVILVDDGCNESFKHDIRVIHQENGGVSKARNKGLDLAQGEYIAFIDSDDMISDDYVAKILDKTKEEWDYCFMSWEYNGGNQVIITDTPPTWNTSVWNCVYKKTLIGNVRFNEKKQIAEDTEFNLNVRKGKKANITDIMYYYHSGREDSLTTKYSKGELKAEVEEVVQAQIIIYRSFLSILGGIETAVYNACNVLKDNYDIVFVYDNIDYKQLKRLSKLVRCVKNTGQKFVCETYLSYGFNPREILSNVTSTKNRYIQQICCDVEAVNFRFIKPDKINIFTADSKASAKTFTKVYPQYQCGVLHNLFDIPEPKRVLNLMSATRLSWEKGYVRMKKIAKRMNELGIPFEWTVFTNDKPDEEIDGFIFRTPRLNVTDYMGNKDYGFQLSETESWGCTVTEFLESGVPVICTDYASAPEQVEDGVNGYILKRDMSNMDEVIHKMYNNNLKGFKHKKKYSKEEWFDILGEGKKTTYIPTPDIDLVEIQALQDYYDTQLEKHIKTGEVYLVCSDRADKITKMNYAKLY